MGSPIRCGGAGRVPVPRPAEGAFSLPKLISPVHRGRGEATGRGPHGHYSVLAVSALVAVLGLTSLINCSTGQTKEQGGVEEKGNANRLIKEKSPYLLQHAYNPVDWYPWGEEAFEKARKEDKPIFLSVGYSTCHWCHVMEHESFENPEIADLINQWFVPIKVDREERPDVDRVYMNAAYALTGGGGWPLTVFLTTDLKPFYAGTYFPPENRYGRPGLPTVLNGIHEAWVNRRQEVNQSAEGLTQAITNNLVVEPDTSGVEAKKQMATACELLDTRYDATYGGFGSAPKFPQPTNLILYLHEWARDGQESLPEPVLHTLRRMALGGMYDHLGGGFHRYSTDAEWKIPHFEKMLYDQAQLVWVYLDAYQITGESFYADVARDVLEYVAREMRHEDGGFFSAEDADSPGPDGEPEEGAFYVWTEAEIDSLLGPERAAPFKKHYHFTVAGNFEKGLNVLHATQTIGETATELGVEPAELDRQLAEDRSKLFDIRAERPRPHLDDKVLTAWNGLMISAYARAYQVLGDERYLEIARDAADFVIKKNHDKKRNVLLRRYRDRESAIDGELTDYAFYVQGLLDLYEAGFDYRDLERSMFLTDRQTELFWDPGRGGFFDTAEGASENLFVRTKTTYDGAEPTGNSVATLNLARLAQMTGRTDLGEKARTTLELFVNHTAGNPLAITQMLVAADFLTAKPKQVVIAGDFGKEDTDNLLRVVHQRYLPRKVVLLADGGKGQKWLAERLPFLSTVQPMDGRATAYVCEDYVCQLPTAEPAVVERQLAAAVPVSGGN
jgi:uncharacterized protein YyaL (SSP411 family)